MNITQRNIKLFLYLIKHYAMKTNEREDVYTQVFLTLALVGGQSSASRPCRFNPGERAPVPIGLSIEIQCIKKKSVFHSMNILPRHHGT
jgi:hypothetical protein